MNVKDIVTSKLKRDSNDLPIKRRSKGEKTREKILIAAIEVLALNGVKGTTHRAIASHANLQLSLTTYYFKDIQELIHQAFKLNSKRILSHADTSLQAALNILTEIPKKELRKTATKLALCEQLTNMFLLHLVDNIKHQAIPFTVEQLMFTETQVSPNLLSLSQEHESAQLIPYEQLCCFFNKHNPEIDAKIMYTVFSQLRYSQLCKQVNIDTIQIEQTVRRIIAWMMSIKQH
jgi:DNA-binding transcriptional regulator YbjK